VSDFAVDYLRLHALGQDLANLRGEFQQGHEAIAPLLGTISDGDLRGKLEGFTDNWSHERTKLIERLDKAAGFSMSAADCYRQLDEALANAMSGGQ
jgi:hypothetical protein